MMTIVNKKTHKPTKNDVYIGRGSKWGNPFVIGRDGDRNLVIDKYIGWFETNDELIKDIDELIGKNLVCYCSPKNCHGHYLLSLLKNAKVNQG